MTVQQTLSRPARVSGVGLHSGVPVTVEIAPGAAGIAFSHRGRRTPARPSEVTATTLCTRLGEVSTVEHLMSALAGAGVTDAEITVSAPELPGGDGSALLFLDAVLAAGLRATGGEEPPRLRHTVAYEQEGTRIVASPGTGRWECAYDLDDRFPGRQTFRARLPQDYRTEVAGARTIVLAEEIPACRSRRIGLGLDETSVVVIGRHEYDRPVRFPDEPARHKLLDLVGDLHLAGIPLGRLDVTAHRSGHRANVRFAQLLTDALGH